MDGIVDGLVGKDWLETSERLFWTILIITYNNIMWKRYKLFKAITQPKMTFIGVDWNQLRDSYFGKVIYVLEQDERE